MFSYHIPILTKEDNITLHRLLLAQLPNEFSIKRLLTFFCLKTNDIEFFKNNLKESVEERYEKVISYKNIKGILLFNFPHYKDFFKMMEEDFNLIINKEDKFFKDLLALINSYYNFLVEPNNEIIIKKELTIREKLEYDITTDYSLKVIKEGLIKDRKKQINHFKKIFNLSMEEYINLIYYDEGTDGLFLIRYDIIKKFIKNWGKNILKIIYSPIIPTDPFCVIVAKVMRDELSELIYYFEEDNFPVSHCDIYKIIIYLCFNYDSFSLVSYLGRFLNPPSIS